jgi:hypothetical protein
MGIEDGRGTTGAADAIMQHIPRELSFLDPIQVTARSKGAGPLKKGAPPFIAHFFRYLLLILLFLLVSFWGTAQTLRDSPVPVVDFVGEHVSLTRLFHDMVLSEVENLNGFSSQRLSAEVFPEGTVLNPDFPPDPAYLGGAPYALTGEYYIDTESLYHFQLWLWNSEIGSLVYTDEMVFEDVEEVGAYMPSMITWIFSHIPQITVMERPPGELEDDLSTVLKKKDFEAESGEKEETNDRKRLFTGRLYLGLQGGGLFNFYKVQTFGNYESDTSQGFGGQGAALAEFSIFPFLSLRAEAVFAYETFAMINSTKVGQQMVHSTSTFTVMSLMFPFLLQVPIRLDLLTLTPFGGVYVMLPLGKVETMIQVPERTALSDSYRIEPPPIGFLAGMEIGISLGPGDVFLDLRFGRDLGMISVEGERGPRYFQDRIGLSLGYKLPVWKL